MTGTMMTRTTGTVGGPEKINTTMTALLFLSLVLCVYLLALSPCWSRLRAALVKLPKGTECLAMLLLILLLGAAIVYSMSVKKHDLLTFRLTCDCCAPKTTTKTGVNTPVVTPSH